MSARAIRALRGEDDGDVEHLLQLGDKEDDYDDDDDDAEDHRPGVKGRSAFALMGDDDDHDDEESSSSSSSSSSGREAVGQEEDTKEVVESGISGEQDRRQRGPNKDSVAFVDDAIQQSDEKTRAEEEESNKRLLMPSNNSDDDRSENATKDEEEEEDLDALLSEFHEKDQQQRQQQEAASSEDTSAASALLPSSTTLSRFGIILEDFNVRDLDYDFSLRVSLDTTTTATTTSSSSSRASRTSYIFGAPRDGWIRPPRLVGGGMGMKMMPGDTMKDDGTTQNSTSVPWPYQQEGEETTTAVPPPFCSFVHSSEYQRDVEDYYTVIQPSGDWNALVLFVAHHPYVTPALLQLSSVLYQTNHSHEGLAFLRRCLWIYECGMSTNFSNKILSNNNNTNYNVLAALLDHDRPENKPFFQALFRLVHVSYIAGLSRTALASSRLLLALDPLRDPMNVLLALDCHAIAASATVGGRLERRRILQWLVRLVESDAIQIFYQDNDAGESTYQCGIRELPNWAYTYPLALFSLHRMSSEFDEEDLQDETVRADDLKNRADQSIRQALSRFPSVVGLLLENLEIDTTGRSFQRDWVTALDFCSDWDRQIRRNWHTSTNDTVTLSATLQTCDRVIRIFAPQGAKLWGEDAVLQWLYDNLQHLVSSKVSYTTSPSPAILRYAGVDPADYDSKIQQLPPDAAANIVDPGLVAHALAISPNRPRFVRMQQHARRGNEDNDLVLDANGNQALRRDPLLGPPTQNIDPDWPMLEVLWRSFLPWNSVEGIPPPRR